MGGARKKQKNIDLWNSLKEETAKALDSKPNDEPDDSVKNLTVESESNKTLVADSEPAAATQDELATNVSEIREIPVNKPVEDSKSTEKLPAKDNIGVVEPAGKPTKDSSVTQELPPKLLVKDPDIPKSPPKSPVHVPTPAEKKPKLQARWTEVLSELRENHRHAKEVSMRARETQKRMSEKISELHASFARTAAIVNRMKKENGDTEGVGSKK
ncbi:hypothetical protein TWF506_011370 [Arthrobotrys conoides]|uniref:Uncharacterized protein n=1 Tax=Arthrobotrys conoides TaxID=74498 RepID=A0AAN8RNY9_9PEZI